MRERRTSVLRSRGFSLIEFITSGALTLLLLAGVGAIFVGSRTSYGKAEQLGRIQENGRYALDQLSRDLRSAGFPGCSSRAPLTAIAPSHESESLRASLRGFDGNSGADWEPQLPKDLAQIAMPRTDVLLITTTSAPLTLRAPMRSSSDALQVKQVNQEQLREGDLMLASNCQARATFAVASITDELLRYEATATHESELTDSSLGFAFPLGTELMRIQTSAYFLRSDPQTTRPALWRQVGSDRPEQLASGIEDLQFTFGVDGNDDGVVDVDTTSDQIDDWAKVRTVSITLRVVAEDSNSANTINGGKSADLRETFTAAVTLRNRATVE